MNDRHLSLGTDGANDWQFFDGYAHIIGKVRAELPGIRITALTPSPYDEVTRPARPEGDNAVLVRFGRWIEDYATSTGLGVADMNMPLVRVLEQAVKDDPEGAKSIIPDRVHPGFGGTLIMAEQLLRAWNARPIVAAVAIDASGATPTVSSVEHSRVSDLSAENGLNWTQLDDALPLPFAEWQRVEPHGLSVSLAVRYSDVTVTLNEQPLKVTGLKEGLYTLRIDGAAVGTFTSAELMEDVNLAVLDTPMTRQAKQVHELGFTHNAVRQASWRQIEVLLASHDLPQRKAALDALAALEAALVEQQREAAQPAPHRFELVPQR
jgi:hypothetical protein